jgi:autonomous glycyl radical cofactor GrcA
MARTLEELHYLFVEKIDRVVAHCLELDIVAVAANTEIAERRLNALVSEQLVRAYGSGNFDQLFFRAPDELWEAMKHAEKLPQKTLRLKTQPPKVLPVEQRQLPFKLPVYRAIAPAAAA